MPDQIEEQLGTPIKMSVLNCALAKCQNLSSDQSTHLGGLLINQASLQDLRAISDRNLEKLPLRLMSDRHKKKHMKTRELVTLGNRVLENEGGEFSILPPTHFIATIEGSTNDAYVDGFNGNTPVSAEAQSSGMVPGLGKWVQHFTHA